MIYFRTLHTLMMCPFIFHFRISHARNISALAEGKAQITQTQTPMNMTTTVSRMRIRSFFVKALWSKYAVMY